jgi:putative SOS response-associated peptidase YedK
MGRVRPRYNAAPSQALLVIRQNHKTGGHSLDLIKWGLIPHWCTAPQLRSPHAKAESVSSLPMFREAYALRRCIVPVDGFFEWRGLEAHGPKQPYAIAMKVGSPFWSGLDCGRTGKNPHTGKWSEPSPSSPCPRNDLVAQIHNRMPAILEPGSYDCWLSPEPDPHDLLIAILQSP